MAVSFRIQHMQPILRNGGNLRGLSGGFATSDQGKYGRGTALGDGLSSFGGNGIRL